MLMGISKDVCSIEIVDVIYFFSEGFLMNKRAKSCLVELGSNYPLAITPLTFLHYIAFSRICHLLLIRSFCKNVRVINAVRQTLIDIIKLTIIVKRIAV